MQINILPEYGKEYIDSLNIEGLVQFVLTEMNCPDKTDVTISFVTNDRIHELNKQYRGIDKPTDVLSFECDNDPFEDEDIDDAQEYELGDVIIATDVALKQTEEFGTTFEEEISLLVTHGLLHLCGYDHIEDDEAEIMEALERKLLSSWSKQN